MSCRGVNVVENNTLAEVRELVAKRIDFLEHLQEHTLQKPGIVDQLDHSRSTVDRAIRELENADLIERTQKGYSTTFSGKLAAEKYREYLSESTEVLDKRTTLNRLPVTSPLDAAVLIDADVHLATGPLPYEPLTHVEDVLEHADRVLGLVPQLPNPHWLRLCRSQVIEEEATVELVVSPALFETLQQQCSRVLMELVAPPTGAVFVTDLPQFTLLLVANDETETVLIILYDDTDSVAGVLVNDSPTATEWAQTFYQTIKAEADDVTDDVIEPDSILATDGAPAQSPQRANSELQGALPTSHYDDSESVAPEKSDTGDRIDDLFRAQLKQEGFVTLDDDYFTQRTPDAPAVGLQTGFDLIDVHAGHAFERECERNGRRVRVTDELLAGLRDDTHYVLVGPPGSGKSTVCKQVACRWYDEADGTVFYRERGRGRSFESAAKLEDQIRRATAPVLVVVEDAVREEANAIFEVMRALDGYDDVAFLLDSRDSEWEDPSGFPPDARLDTLRTTALDRVTVPDFDEQERQRLSRYVTETLEMERNEIPADFFRVEESNTKDSDSSPGTMLRFGHRLSHYTTPLTDSTTRTPTTLTEDVQRVLNDLREVEGHLALDVGIIVNVLNIAGISLSRELIYAVDDPTARADIANILDLLEGRVLFHRGEAHADDGAPRRYCAVHESWSELFLEHVLEMESTQTVQRRFGYCITALLSVASDESVQAHVESAVGDDTPYLDRIRAAPKDWVEEFVTRVFTVGRERTHLAPLFGTTEYSRIELPDCCAPEIRLKITYWRGDMYWRHGDFETAEHEYQLVNDKLDAIDEVPEDVTGTIRTQSLRGLGNIQSQRGEQDAAIDYFSRAVEVARRVGDTRSEVRGLLDLGHAALRRSAYADAEEWYTECLSRARDLGDRQTGNRALTGLGVVASQRGEYETAEAYYEESLAVARDIGDTRNEANALGNLGVLARDHNDLTTAEHYFLQKLDRAREVGERSSEANALFNLGMTYCDQGDLETAEEYARKSLEQFQDIGEQPKVAECRYLLGKIAFRRGNFDEAESMTETSRDLFREVESDRGTTYALRNLGRLALHRGNLKQAEDYVTESLEICRTMNNQQGIATCYRLLATISRHRGELATADDYSEQSYDRFCELDQPVGIAESLRERGLITLERGRCEEATHYLTRGLEHSQDTEEVFAEARVRTALGELAKRSNNPQTARDHLQQAADIYRDAGAIRELAKTCATLSELSEQSGDLDQETEWERQAHDIIQQADWTIDETRWEHRHTSATEG